MIYSTNPHVYPAGMVVLPSYNTVELGALAHLKSIQKMITEGVWWQGLVLNLSKLATSQLTAPALSCNQVSAVSTGQESWDLHLRNLNYTTAYVIRLCQYKQLLTSPNCVQQLGLVTAV